MALMVLALMSFTPTAKGAYVNSTAGSVGGNSLGELIVLDKMFDNGSGNGDGTLGDIGELIVLDSLFSGRSFNNTGVSGVTTTSTGLLSGYTNGIAGNSLGELIVLDQMFDDGGDNQGTTEGNNDSTLGDLGELIVLDGLFNGGIGGVTGSTVTRGGEVVVVQSGDTLSGIASTFLGSSALYPQIAAVNNLGNPNLIYPGQRLVLPNVTATSGGVVSATNGIAGNSLGELIVLDQMFDDGNDGGDGSDGSLGDIGELIVLDGLFGGTSY
jgi:LysM repeat protein